MFCVGFLCCILLYSLASVSSVSAEMSQLKVVLFLKKGPCHVVFCPFWVLLSELVVSNSGSGVSLSLFLAPSLCLSPLLPLSLSVSCPFILCYGVWFALLNSLPSPLSPLPSPVNKQPEPAPRRVNTVNRKQPHLTSPTYQPLLPPLEAWVPAQPEPLSPATEAEQPGLIGGGGGVGVGGGLGGGVQVATVKPHVVTQLSAEEIR